MFLICTKCFTYFRLKSVHYFFLHLELSTLKITMATNIFPTKNELKIFVIPRFSGKPSFSQATFLSPRHYRKPILITTDPRRAARNVTRDISTSRPLSEFHYSYVKHYYTEFIAGKCAPASQRRHYRVTVLSSERVYCFRLWCTETATSSRAHSRRWYSTWCLRRNIIPIGRTSSPFC